MSEYVCACKCMHLEANHLLRYSVCRIWKFTVTFHYCRHNEHTHTHTFHLPYSTLQHLLWAECAINGQRINGRALYGGQQLAPVAVKLSPTLLPLLHFFRDHRGRLGTCGKCEVWEEAKKAYMMHFNTHVPKCLARMAMDCPKLPCSYMHITQ